MNKTQLIEQLKQPEDKVNSLLSAAAIAADLKDYTKDQLLTLQTIDQLVESGKAKTYKVAAELYRQQQESDPKSIEAEEFANQLDCFIEEEAQRAAKQSLSALPGLVEAEHNRLEAEFIKAYRKHVIKGIQDPKYREAFEAEMLGKTMGKPKISNTSISNIALPSSSSFSS